MTKGRKGKPGKSKPEVPVAKATAKAAAKADRGLRKHLKRLQRQLADAARTEARRVRKLERARWRRQRLESEVDDARTASTVGPDEAASKSKSKPKAAPAPKAAPVDPATSKGQAVEAYCRREKRRVQMVDPRPVVTANGRSALSGTCPSCGASLHKLVSRTAR